MAVMKMLEPHSQVIMWTVCYNLSLLVNPELAYWTKAQDTLQTYTYPAGLAYGTINTDGLTQTHQ